MILSIAASPIFVRSVSESVFSKESRQSRVFLNHREAAWALLNIRLQPPNRIKHDLSALSSEDAEAGSSDTILFPRHIAEAATDPYALLNLQHRCRVSLWHLPDRDAGDFSHRLEVDHRHGVRPGVGHVSCLAVGCECNPVGCQPHVSAAQQL